MLICPTTSPGTRRKTETATPVRHLFQRCAANTSSRRAESGITPHIWHEENGYSKTWRHPNNFSRVGSQRRYLTGVTNLEEHMPNVKNSGKFELWGHVFSLRFTVQGNPSGPSACIAATVRAVCSVTVVLYVGIIPIKYPDVVNGARLQIFSSNIAPRLTSRTAPSRVGPTFKFVNKMETNFLEP